MSDELLGYYNSELAFIRRMGARFAREYPKVAGRLALSSDTTEDPHVERIIEAFAYLNARVRHKLDDDFPELSDSLLGVIYPHYQRPIPSMAVVELVLDPEQGELTGGYAVPRGAPVESDSHPEPCHFQTCYPVTLWPLTVRAASLARPPLAAPKTPFTATAASAIRIVLESTAKELRFGQLSLDRLRLFLRGQDQHAFGLYELILNNVVGIALAGSAEDRQPVLLGPDSLRPVGFERDQGMLPYPARSFLGYRILTEFFSFPQKFLFVELANLAARKLPPAATRLEIYLFLDKAAPQLEPHVTAETFRLGCTPIVNLYPQRAEPIRLTQTRYEYRVVPDARRPLANEIYSVDRVVATSPAGGEVKYRPFYSFKHGSGDLNRDEAGHFWHAARRPALADSENLPPPPGDDVFLSLVDLTLDPASPAEWILDVETTCFNRDLPSQLPFGDGLPRMRLTQGGPIHRVLCHTRPTPVARPALRRGALWKLISHLSLNHLSMSENEEGADALREILALYDFQNSAGTRGMIEGIRSVAARRIVAPVAGPANSAGPFARGVEITVELDETRFVGSGLFLFATVLERFLGLYCSINSFTKTIVKTKQRGELRRWPPRAGERALL